MPYRGSLTENHDDLSAFHVMRRSWIPIAIVALPFATCGAWYGYSSWWWAGAEAAVQSTVTATAAQRPPAQGIVARIDSSGALRPSVDFRLAYTIVGADNFPTGTSPAALLSLGAWVAHLQFSNGHVYHAEARRAEGVWVVDIGPGEGQ